jgi:ABC-type ATPase with predicted acetyltransferase domain
MRPTPRQLRVSAIFGLDPAGAGRSRRGHPAQALAAAKNLRAALRPGQIALITGPSGSGKSTLLRALFSLRRQTRDGARLVRAPSPGGLRRRARALADLFPHLSLGDTLRTLARAGLAEASLFALQPAQLSEGQLHRLACAAAWARASRPRAPSIILVDEFASTLDRPTARALAASLRRAVERSRVSLIAATAHDDLLESLAPDILVLCTPHEAPVLHTRKAAA